MNLMGTILTQQLKKRRYFLYAGYITVIASYAAGLYLLFIDLGKAVIIFNFATLLYFFGVRTMDRNYGRRFVTANLSLVYSSILGKISILKRGNITGQSLASRKLVPAREKGGAACSSLLEGQMGKSKVTGCDVTICFDRTSDESRHKVGLLNGIWVETEKPESRTQTFLLIPKLFLKKGIEREFYLDQGLKEFTLANRTLDNSYMLFGSEDSAQKDADLFVRQYKSIVMALSEKDHAVAAIRQDSQGICAFFPDQSLSFPVPLRGELSEEVISWNRTPQVTALLRCAV